MMDSGMGSIVEIPQSQSCITWDTLKLSLMRSFGGDQALSWAEPLKPSVQDHQVRRSGDAAVTTTGRNYYHGNTGASHF